MAWDEFHIVTQGEQVLANTGNQVLVVAPGKEDTEERNKERRQRKKTPITFRVVGYGCPDFFDFLLGVLTFCSIVTRKQPETYLIRGTIKTMQPVTEKNLFACLLCMSGFVFTANLSGQTSEMLNQLDNYASATGQLVFSDSYTCSGVLINNTQERGRPLILTAAHCIEGEEDLESVKVIFGNRKIIREQPYDGLEWSSTGASLLAMSNKLDFALLELKSRIPASLSPMYLGWNKKFSRPALIYCIHSPDFGNVQYSVSMAKPSVATFGGLYNAVDSGHWRVDKWARGATDLGSSGAPLLDSNFQIIGGLSGSTDWKNSKSDYFFRFDLAYDQFGNTTSQLKYWIDPAGAGSIGHYRTVRKIRNYNFTSNEIETIKLFNGKTVSEEFYVSGESQINGVYVVMDEISNCTGSKTTVALSRDNSILHTEETDTCVLTEFSENYIRFEKPVRVNGKFSVSLGFLANTTSTYITIPNIETDQQASLLFAVNAAAHTGPMDD